MKLWTGFTLATAVSIRWFFSQSRPSIFDQSETSIFSENQVRVRRNIDGATEICRFVGGTLKCGGGGGGGGTGGATGGTDTGVDGLPAGGDGGTGGDKPAVTTARPAGTQPPATQAPVTTAKATTAAPNKPTEAVPVATTAAPTDTLGQVPIKPGVNTPGTNLKY